MITKSGKHWPKDFFLTRNSKDGKTYKFKRDKRLHPFEYTEDGKKLVKMQHHPVALLIPELILYDLNDRNERAQFLALCASATIIDDYGLIAKRMPTINGLIHEVNATDDMNEFINSLVEAENKLKQVTATLEVDEIAEARAHENLETDAIRIITQDEASNG